jgi:predicted Rossmann fold nucleotide-binding protein DprA/Smf involved in DNA uptake
VALEQGREVFSVRDSPRDPRQKGTNGLLRDRAILMETPQDIISQISKMLKTVAASQGFVKLLPETPKNISKTETAGAHDEVMNYWAPSR